MSFDQLEAALEERRSAHLYRRRRLLQSPQGPEVVVDGVAGLAFCSNDYLGLANHPALQRAMIEGVERFGVGGGASHLVMGHTTAHHALEEALAEWTGRPRALLFSTGYMANMGSINALLDKQDAVFEDRLNHASLLDGGLLSGARFQRYLHNDVDSLTQRLGRTDARRKLVVTDGVFSMDGDIADLPGLSAATREAGGWLMVDDAHGFGCLGQQGGGCVEHFGLGIDEVPVLMGTLGKAFGTAGAFVAGSETLIETLIQFARSYIYTTSMPPAVAWATLASLKLVREESWRRDKLNQLIAQFRRGAAELGFELMDSPTPIQPIVIGEADQALGISQALEQQGIYVTAIRPPTVPVGSSRLRVTLTATHSEEQVNRLLEALNQARGALSHGAISQGATSQGARS
ncbi:8-amino-7-oxononanoate synthase [Marinobacterium zhoushanense]|uniref:8-amino-7-oxononanoate synthase n=1 Tax=Marinobacterium zhoushanense TaxID=1679163 RepID=A0ABQ1K6P7_9GAMM|nr:8-amino-7-oxononanoate synthase [Marinobacterium zhoushanense]GGB88330.1 8-amino-7-oxononanoate synthase [Marinobacterium zhoushanense]